MTDRTKDLEHDLGSLIAKHADWLSGPDFLRAAERVAQGYFDDAEHLHMIDVQAFEGALESAEVSP